MQRFFTQHDTQGLTCMWSPWADGYVLFKPSNLLAEAEGLICNTSNSKLKAKLGFARAVRRKGLQ